MAAYPIVYTTQDGRSDVVEFLEALPDDVLSKCRAHLIILAEAGRPLQRPFAAPLRDGIWELRVHAKRVQYRFLFAQLPGRTYVVLLAIRKSGAKVPSASVDEARRRLADWRARERR